MSTLHGTWSLLRLVLRRDRIRLPAWVLAIPVLVLATASSWQQLYHSAAERAPLTATFGANPTFKALYGPAFDLSTTGGLTAWRIAGNSAVLAALMSLLLVVRHTRAEEDAGRGELLGATVVGRHAALAAALAAAGIANLAVALLVALGLVGLGLPAGGSVALGLSIGLAGCTFAGIAGVSAQVASTSRAAAGTAGALLGLAFVLRAVGDLTGSPLSWLSPIGWVQQARSFADERWWVLGLPVAATAVLVTAAFALVSRRDHGAGLLPERHGPEGASPRLGSPLGLAWRLQRGLLAGWTLAYLLGGLVVGSVATDVRDLADESPQLADVLRRLAGGADIVDAYLAGVLGLLALVAAGYMIQAVLRVHAEETTQRGELVLATAVSRERWAGAHLACAALGTIVLMAAAGLAMGVAHGLRGGDLGVQVPRLLAAGLVQVPAAWVLGTLAFALFGLLPGLVLAAWAAFAACIGLAQIGELLELPDWALDLSPFRHAPQLPATDLRLGPWLALLAITAALALAGMAGLRRRDVA